MISVVIPAYKNVSDVRTLLGSLEKHCCSAVPYEVIVVDDGSEDPGFEVLAGEHPRMRLVRLPTNAGAPTARNVGVRASAYDVMLFLDSDMQVLADVVAIAAEMFQQPDVVAAVGAVDPEPGNPTPFTRFWGLVKAHSLPQGEESSTFYPMIGVIRKDVFLKLGGFDERIKGASIEDHEISVRIRAAGVKVHYNPRLFVRTSYHPMWKSLRQSFSRSGKWLLLFAREPRFDNHTTTASQAVGMATGACFVASLGLAFVSPRLVLVSATLLSAYVLVNLTFFRYVARTAGWRFLPTAFVFHLLLSVVVCAGVARAVPYLPFGRERRLVEVYRGKG